MKMCKEIREKFQELYSLNVNQYVEKKNDLSYLSWSYAWAEFKKIYPDATYEVKKDEQGRCYFGDELFGYMVYTSVTAGGLTYEMWLPVMDGANKAMKPLAYTYTTRYGEKTVEPMTVFDVNKTVMRCLVKNLAMFGLGLYIYAGEDLPQDIKEYVCADCGKVVDSNMAQRTHKAFGVHLCKECGLERSKKKEEGTNGS
jgi:DNA-directed RNA polymerase subunit RPC12/RpoP